MAILTAGTDLYKSFVVLYMPLSQKAMWFLAVTPTSIFLFYFAVSVGEELIKIAGYKIAGNWLYKHTGVSTDFIIAIGFVISLIGWLMLHFISWGTITILSLAFGIIISYIFVAPYWLLGDPLISPEKGVQLGRVAIWAPIGGHLAYDFFLGLHQEGLLVLTMSQGLVISGALTGFGLLMLAICYIRKGLPLFGYIPI